MKYLKLSLHKYNRKRKGKSINVKENENNITKTFAYQTERGDLTQYNRALIYKVTLDSFS